MTTHRSVWCLNALILAAACHAPHAFAARDFTPQSGTWSIVSERNGQPGRGMAIDVQGNTLFMQVYGYDRSGAANFHTAMGTLNGASMTAPLVRYAGGRYFGSGAIPGHEAGSAGAVTVTFENGLSGTIQFPGEGALRIERMLLTQSDPRYRDLLDPIAVPGWDPYRYMSWVGRDASGARNLWDISMQRTGVNEFALEVSDQKRVRYRISTNPGSGFDNEYLPSMKMRCTRDEATQVFDCTRLPFTSREVTTGVWSEDIGMPIQRVKFRLLGRDIVGWMQTDEKAPQKLELNGLNQGAVGAGISCVGQGIATQAYVREFLDFNEVCLGAMPPIPPVTPPAGFTDIRGNTVLPVNGTWVVEGESNGKPGRGISLDVQDTVLVAQIANYRADGSPTFHTAVGTFVASPETGNVSEARARLFEYRGGRFFGGPAQSAALSADAGELVIRFDRASSSSPALFSTGSIQFPGEPPRRIRRMLLESKATQADRMTGEFYLRLHSYDMPAKHYTRLETLSRMTDEIVGNADTSVVCNSNVTEGVVRIGCYDRKLPVKPVGNEFLGSLGFMHDPFERVTDVVRTRDRYGNWTGLGAVHLPGLQWD